MTDSIKKVLIVDDDRINLLQLKKILEKDYNILTASNGIDALKILKEGVSNQVSAVILDIIMPGMNGYAVLKTMREDIDLAQIPVLAVSCQENSDDKELKTLSLGAIDYVLKPYNPLIIKYRLSNIIYLHETSNYIYQVQHDSLTGLYNQKGFFKAVHERLIKTNDKYDMICSDIKKFKLVDDLYGAEIGDKLLIHCAEVF